MGELAIHHDARNGIEKMEDRKLIPIQDDWGDYRVLRTMRIVAERKRDIGNYDGYNVEAILQMQHQIYF